MQTTDRSLTERMLRQDRLVLVALVAALFSLAALYTVFGIGMRMSALEMTAMRGMRDMPGATLPGDWTITYGLLVFLMWWVMMVAMMLPSIAPTVLLHAALTRHAGRTRQVAGISCAFLLGYLAIWGLFSLIATILQWWLEAAGVVSATMMTLIDSVPGGLVLIVAGVYQFTPLKTACLSQCRAPVKFLSERRKDGISGAFAMGAEHGFFCLGCCWVLMALLFVGGIMNLFWIVGLTAFTALEKLTPFGDTLARIAGAGLIAWGFVIVFGNL